MDFFSPRWDKISEDWMETSECAGCAPILVILVLCCTAWNSDSVAPSVSVRLIVLMSV